MKKTEKQALAIYAEAFEIMRDAVEDILKMTECGSCPIDMCSPLQVTRPIEKLREAKELISTAHQIGNSEASVTIGESKCR